jgi:hypothetical protein
MKTLTKNNNKYKLKNKRKITKKNKLSKKGGAGSGEGIKNTREFNGYVAITEELLKYNPFASEYLYLYFFDRSTNFNKTFNGFNITRGMVGVNIQLSQLQSTKLMNEYNDFRNEILSWLRGKDTQGIQGYSNFKLIESMDISYASAANT